MPRPVAFLDIAIGDVAEHQRQQEAFERAYQFAQEVGHRYGIDPSAPLNDSSQEILAEAYASDPAWSARGPATWQNPGSGVAGRITVELYSDVAPKAAENFAVLCTGSRGLGKASKKPLHFKGCPFHRVQRGFCCQGGDVVKGDGSSGDSVFGGKFNDEKAALKLKHDRAGVLSMANSGKNSNTSQFFFTLAPAPQCDGRHVVFGEVKTGLELLKRIDDEAATESGAPKVVVSIVDCGVLPEQ